MQWVALMQSPVDLEYATGVITDAIGCTAAEARMRLAPEPPAFLARLEPERAEQLVTQLRARDFRVVTVSELPPDKRGWLQGRAFSLQGPEAVFTAAGGEQLQMQWDSVVAVLRGSTRERTSQETTTTTKKIDIKKAVITGGLKFTSTETNTVRSQATELEGRLYLFDEWGQGVVLKELSLQFIGLGPRMQPTRTANMNTLAALLRERCPRAFYDDRLVRLGTRTLPQTPGTEQYVHTKDVSRRVESTASSVDLMAEALRVGVLEGYLPRSR